MIVVNVSAMVAQAYIHLNGQLEIDPHMRSVYTLYDRFNDQVYKGRQGDLRQNGLYVRLDPMGCHIFSLEAGAAESRKNLRKPVQGV
jgi:hypothetical protein